MGILYLATLQKFVLKSAKYEFVNKANIITGLSLCL